MKLTKNKKIIILAAVISIVLINVVILVSIYGIIDINDINGNSDEEHIFYDSLGRYIEVPEHPERIISMAPAITEILYKLEVDDRLYGVTSYCDYPEDTQFKTKIGGFSSPNIELIVSLEPDLIITSRDDQDVINVLESYDLTIVYITANSLDDIIGNIKDIGDLVDAKEKAEEITNVMEAKMNLITDKTGNLNPNDKLKVYFEVWETPKVVGKNSFLDDMIDKAGGINIFGDIEEEFPIVSHESVIINNPHVIFITAMGRTYYTSDVSEREGYKVVNAVINDRIYDCDDNIYTRAGPRIIDALENMTLYLYPNIFN